nr:13928_t:CDS:2 [Entrophospora candida]
MTGKTIGKRKPTEYLSKDEKMKRINNLKKLENEETKRSLVKKDEEASRIIQNN